MSAIIMNGTELAKNIKMQVKKDVRKLNRKNIYPKLAVISVGNNKASQIYIRNKTKACYETGILFEEILLDENITMNKLLKTIEQLNKREDIHAILLQSPLPKGLDIYKAFAQIDYRKDIDGFSPINIGRLVLNRQTFISCTAQGIIKLLKEYNINLEGANVVILGRSNIVGKPLAQCLLNEDATVTICHSKTKNIEEITKTADILISAVGKEKLVTENMIKDGSVVIDVGINKNEQGKIVGDVDFENVKNKASYISPVPGGVGPLTVAMLMNNVIIATKYLENY